MSGIRGWKTSCDASLVDHIQILLNLVGNQEENVMYRNPQATSVVPPVRGRLQWFPGRFGTVEGNKGGFRNKPLTLHMKLSASLGQERFFGVAHIATPGNRRIWPRAQVTYLAKRTTSPSDSESFKDDQWSYKRTITFCK